MTVNNSLVKPTAQLGWEVQGLPKMALGPQGGIPWFGTISRPRGLATLGIFWRSADGGRRDKTALGHCRGNTLSTPHSYLHWEGEHTAALGSPPFLHWLCQRRRRRRRSCPRARQRLLQ